MVKDRINTLRDFLREKKLEGIIVSKLENVFYFSGFTGDDTMALIIDVVHSIHSDIARGGKR